MTASPRSCDLVQLVRIARGCWLPADAVPDLVLRCIAVLESSAPDSVIVSVTAAVLHRLWLPPIPDTIHVATATPGRAGNRMTRTRRPEFVAHRYQLRPDDITVVEGVRVTSLARTWVHLAPLLSLPDLVAAGDCALRSGATMQQLEVAAGRSTHTRRPSKLALALPLLDQRSRSRPESHLRVAVAAPDIPRFEVNMPARRADGGWLFEPDLSLSAARLALEYQGEHHAEVRRMRRDITRKADARTESWTVWEYGPTEVFARPSQIRAEVREFLRTTVPHLLLPVRARAGRPQARSRPVSTDD